MQRRKFITQDNSSNLMITAVSQGMDNYAYVISNPLSGEAALVDALESESLFELEERLGVKITTIFNTHHHGDHVGANRKIKEIRESEGLKLHVYGSQFDFEHERITYQTKVVNDGDKIHWAGHLIKVFEIPGHTLGHLGYLLDKHFFCGDTVFLGGCGRLFEGTPAQMYQSIHHTIAPLGPHIKLYPAHEYSLQNLRFASWLFEDEQLQHRMQELQVKLQSNGTTLPTTVAHEFAYNPFFKIADESYRSSLKVLNESEKNDPVMAFAKIRALKDSF